MRTVLVVCQANTARSVMAQALLQRMLAERGIRDSIRVSSGGIAPFARDGMLASLDARLALREEGIELAEDAVVSTDLKQHRERIAEADLIVTMTERQKAALAAFEEAAGKPVFTLRGLGGEEGDIGDPAGQGEDTFRVCRDEIKRCLERSLDRLLALLP